MTPDEELRAAAEKLRALAATATPGPWTAKPVIYGPPEDGWGEPSDWEISSKDHTVISHQMHEGGGIDHGPNAAFITAMHPGVGAALADWLDFHAAMGERLQSLFGEELPNDDDIKHPALAVARTILGSQP
jgi:hypothetical protein